MRKSALLVAVAWLPLLGLALASGAGGPFVRDFATHVRMLLAVPLLAGVGGAVDGKLAHAIAHCREARLIEPPGRARFDAHAVRLRRLGGSRVTLALLVPLAYASTLVALVPVWRGELAHWAVVPATGRLSPPGWWLAMVAMPLLTWLLLSGLLRLVVWALFVLRISRLPLALTPAHPDRAGGLLFLGHVPAAFRGLVLAGSAVVAAAVGQRVRLEHGHVSDYGAPLAIVGAVALLLLFAPLLSLAPTLRRLRARGVHDFGILGGRYGRGFSARWCADPRAPDDAPLGTPDLQSLADLGTAYERVEGLRLVPCTRRNLLEVAAAFLVPLLPLAVIDPAMIEAARKLSRLLV